MEFKWEQIAETKRGDKFPLGGVLLVLLQLLEQGGREGGTDHHKISSATQSWFIMSE